MFAVLNYIYYNLAVIYPMYELDRPVESFFVSIVIGLIVALILVGQSHTKVKAKKAEKYIKMTPVITEQSDVYSHTSTEKRKVN